MTFWRVSSYSRLLTMSSTRARVRIDCSRRRMRRCSSGLVLGGVAGAASLAVAPWFVLRVLSLFLSLSLSLPLSLPLGIRPTRLAVRRLAPAVRAMETSVLRGRDAGRV